MATRMVRRALLAAFCLIPTFAPAFADGIRNTTCLRIAGAFTCTTQWRTFGPERVYPWQIDPRETAASAERERKWLVRCQPVQKEDALGVSRYVYAASGCEFGKLQD